MNGTGCHAQDNIFFVTEFVETQCSGFPKAFRSINLILERNWALTAFGDPGQ